MIAGRFRGGSSETIDITKKLNSVFQSPKPSLPVRLFSLKLILQVPRQSAKIIFAGV